MRQQQEWQMQQQLQAQQLQQQQQQEEWMRQQQLLQLQQQQQQQQFLMPQQQPLMPQATGFGSVFILVVCAVVPNYAAARTIHSHPRSPCQHLPYLRSYLLPRRRQVPFRSTCKARTDRVRRRRLRLRFRSLRRLNLLGHSRCLQSRPARTINIHNSPICLQIAKTVLIRSATGVTSGEFLRVLARRRF